MNPKLKRSASHPLWQERLRDLLLAGGALGVVGCTGHSVVEGVPCGNANPDPCVCGRPEASAEGAKACAKKTACVRAGRGWWFTSDGSVVCLHAPATRRVEP